MQPYQNTILAYVNGVLTPMASASVAVYLSGTTTLATIYSDNGVTTKTNPTATDTNGNVLFYAADGRYDILISKTSYASTTLSSVILDDTQDSPNFVTSNLLAFWQSTVNSYNQVAMQNKSTGISASADFIAYANNGTDAHGWADWGINSSGYADPLYTCVGPNEAYALGSAPQGAGTTGNMVHATDNTGTANAFQWYPGGFTQAKTAYKMQLDQLGNLYTKPPATPPTLAVNGDMVMNLTSNTNLRVSVRGSDGVTRVANLTLA